MSRPRTARNSANAQNDNEPADCNAPRATRKKGDERVDVRCWSVGPWGPGRDSLITMIQGARAAQLQVRLLEKARLVEIISRDRDKNHSSVHWQQVQAGKHESKQARLQTRRPRPDRNNPKSEARWVGTSNNKEANRCDHLVEDCDAQLLLLLLCCNLLPPSPSLLQRAARLVSC